MNETVYRKAFKTQQSYALKKNLYRTRKSNNFQRNCLFSFTFKSFQLFVSNVLSHFLKIPLYQPGINIAPNAHGHHGKILSRVLANRSARYIFTSDGHIIIRLNNATHETMVTDVLPMKNFTLAKQSGTYR